MPSKSAPAPAGRSLRARSPIVPRAIGLACLVGLALALRAMVAARTDAPAWLPWVPAGVGALSVAYAASLVLVLLRRARFGRPTLELADPDFARGSWLEAELRVPRRLRTERGLTAHLTCLETTTRRDGSGDAQTSTSVIWQDSLHLSDEAWTSAPEATAARLAFWIPADARTNEGAGRSTSGVRWFVTVEARLEGPNLVARFELPMPEASTGAGEAPPAPELPGRLAPDQLLGASRLRLVRTDAGIELHTPMLASPKMALGLGLFTGMFATATRILSATGAPWWFCAVFGTVSLLMLLVTAHAIFGRGRLRFDERELHYAHGIPGLQNKGRIEWASLGEVAVRGGDRVGETQLFDLAAERASGARQKLVRDLPDRPTAEALALFIEAQRGNAFIETQRGDAFVETQRA